MPQALLIVELRHSLELCRLATETGCLAAGFALFDAGLQPTSITESASFQAHESIR